MQNLFDAAHGNLRFKQFKVSDMLFTEYQCLEDKSVFDIWSHYNYFVYVLSGKKQWDTRHSAYMVYAGELIFVKKGANIIHKFFEEDFCALLIFVPDDFIKEVVGMRLRSVSKDSQDNTESVIPLEVDHTLYTYFQSLYAYFHREQAPPIPLLEVKFKELLLNLATSQVHNKIRAYFKSLCLHTKPSIRAIMEANFTYNLTLEDFARICGRSLTVFKRDFKEIYHCSPGRWLTQKRLEYARDKLVETDKNINELIFDCGFENASHFTRIFKEKFGLTPLEYKRFTQDLPTQ